MQKLCSYCWDWGGKRRLQAGCTDLAKLLLQDTEGKKVPFVDTGVYTRNRAFRLVMSSKAGKNATLQNTGMPLYGISVASYPVLHVTAKLASCCSPDHPEIHLLQANMVHQLQVRLSPEC